MSLPTLEFTVTGSSLRGMIAEAEATADAFFGSDVPFRLVAFPVRVEREVRGPTGVVDRVFAADAVYEVDP